MNATPSIPGNPFENALQGYAHESVDGAAVTNAIAALAFEQHQRNRLAAITALSKGLDLPPDLEDLAREGVER